MLHFAAATKKVKRAYFVLSGGEAPSRLLKNGELR
jgi:hypothetical protein